MSATRNANGGRVSRNQPQNVTNLPPLLPYVQLLVGNVAVALEDVSSKFPVQTIVRQLRTLTNNTDLQAQLTSTCNGAYKFYVLDPPLYEHEFKYSDNSHLVANSVDLLRARTKSSALPTRALATILLTHGITVGEGRVVFYIVPPTPLEVLIEQELQSTYPELYASLIIETTDRWSEEDIARNGVIFCEGSDAPTSVKDMIRRLATPREYTVSTSGEEYRTCGRVPEDTVGKYFVQEPASRSSPSTEERSPEFASFAFIDVLVEELGRSDVLDNACRSALKAAMMTSSYIVPPAMAHRREKIANYAIDTPWPSWLKILVKQGNEPAATYQPKSDFSFSSFNDFDNMPYLIGEFASETDGSDRWRMLCQAIALVRVGTHIWTGSDGIFAVMVVYVTDNLTAERYLVYQPDPSSRNVHMVRHTFALGTREGGRDFLLNMYNYGTEMARFDGGFRAMAFFPLTKMMVKCEKLRSWSDQSKRSRSGNHDRSRDSCTDYGKDQDSVDESRLALLAEDVLADLGLDNFIYIFPDNPFIAKAWRNSDASHECYLKLVRPNRSEEADILEYLARVDTPNNHVVRPIAVRRVTEGTLLLLPDVGVPVRDYSHLSESLLSVVHQFFEGVAFLHKHKVAHCDLKPSNVLVDSDTGLVTIIDFDLAIQGPKEVEGFAGTDGWTAPEVGGAGRYNPIKADLWAAGKVVRTLCETCPPTVSRKLLLDLCHSLMDPVPAKRPAMQKVVDTLDRYSSFAQVLPPAAEPGLDL